MTSEPRTRRSLRRGPYPFWLAAVVVVIFVAPNLLVLATGAATSASPTPAYPDQQQVASLVAALVFQLVLFGLALLPLLLARRLDRRLLGPARRRGLAWTAGVGSITGVAATIGSYGVNALLVPLLGTQEPVQQQLLEDAVSGGASLMLVIVMAVVVAPITEEIVFRGVLFRSLADRFGGSAGVVCSAAVFAAIHIEVMLSQPVALAGLFVIGAVLAEAYRRTAALAVPMLGHALFNASSIGLAVLLDRAATPAALVTAVLPG